MARLISLLKEKCPNCEQGDIFEYKGNVFLFKNPKMRKRCPVCNYIFEREPGYYWGAMYFSYALAIAEGIVVYFLCFLIFDDPYDYRTVLLILLALLLLSFVNLRYSRLLWMYLFTSRKEHKS